MLKVLAIDTGEEFFLRAGEYRVGRVQASDLVVPHDTVSRTHARLWHGHDSWWIRDLDSTNGTRLDGRPLGDEPAVIRGPVTLEIGQVRLEVCPWDAEDVLTDQVRTPPVRVDLGESTQGLDPAEQRDLQTEMDFFHCIMEVERPEDFYATAIPAYLERSGIQGFGVVVEIRRQPVLRFAHGRPPNAWLWRDEVARLCFHDPLHLPPDDDSPAWFSTPFRVRRERAAMYLLADAADIPERVPETLRRRLLELARLLYLITASPHREIQEEVEPGDDDEGLVRIPGHKEPILLASAASRRLVAELRALAGTKAGVILEGETGVGKEIAAALIHHFSKRPGPFLPVMTSSLPENLVENELFGHQKGAYSGATSSEKGKFAAADKGTVFLDEVADMPAAVQAKLLRVLENGEVFPIGATTPRNVDVRLVAASNVPFKKLVEEKRLRRDVYYRLKTFQIHIPPLRERRNEILPLFEFFLSRAAGRQKKSFKGISPKAVRLLLNYPWPGNVRELKNEAERVALLMKGSGVVHGETLNEEVRAGDRRGREAGPELRGRMDSLERRLIAEALAETAGNKSRAASLLGVSRKGLNIKLKRLGME